MPVIDRVILDECDADLRHVSWRATRRLKAGRIYYHFRRTIRSARKSLAAIVLQRKLGRNLRATEMPDHKNNDTLDNRRSNLRLASNRQNQHNSLRRADNSSGFKGVSLDHGKWRATIRINGVKRHLGMFDSAAEAAAAYDRAAVENFGRFARTNKSIAEM